MSFVVPMTLTETPRDRERADTKHTTAAISSTSAERMQNRLSFMLAKRFLVSTSPGRSVTLFGNQNTFGSPVVLETALAELSILRSDTGQFSHPFITATVGGPFSGRSIATKQ